MLLSRSARRRLAAPAAAVVLLTACAGTDDGEAGAPAGTAEDVADDDVADDGMTDDGVANDDMEDDASHDDEATDGMDDGADGMDDGADEMDDASDGMDDASDETADEGEAADGVLGVAATAPDGSTFAIADFDGPVLVETFATWCSNCRAQLRDTQVAAAAAGDGAVFLALSVETTLDPAELAAYAADNGFDDILFGVLDDDGLVTLQDEFGGAVLSPPSTPKFRVDGDAVSALTTGYESSDEILASLGL